MSREEIIQKTTNHYCDLLQFLKDNPDILERWKSKSLALTRRQADATDTNSSFAKQRDDDIP